MIPIAYYTTIYYLCIASLTLLLCWELTKYKNTDGIPRVQSLFFAAAILGIAICFIGLRDPYGSWRYFGDTSAYTRVFQNIDQIDVWKQKDKGFYIYMRLISSLGVEMFFLISAIIYVVLPHLTFRKWFGKYAFIATVLMVTSMSFWSFGINGVRNGLATALFIFALGFYPNKLLTIALVLLSSTFHKSMYMPMVCLFVAYFYKDTKKLMLFWCLAVVISFVLGKQLNTFIEGALSSIGFDDSRAETYFSNKESLATFTTGYRFDFVLYSALPIILGYSYLFKKGFSDVLYKQILNTYLIANTLWLFMIYAPFTNRTAYLSWFLMPVVLIYPLLKEIMFKRQFNMIIFILLGSITFTLMMYFK